SVVNFRLPCYLFHGPANSDTTKNTNHTAVTNARRRFNRCQLASPRPRESVAHTTSQIVKLLDARSGEARGTIPAGIFVPFLFRQSSAPSARLASPTSSFSTTRSLAWISTP